MQTRDRPGQRRAARADHRHPRRAGVRARAGGDRALRRSPTTTSPTTALRAGRLMAAMFPTVLLIINVSSIAVLWIGADCVNRGRAADRLADRLPQLPHPDPDVAVVMATFLVSMIPRATVAPTASSRCSTRRRRSLPPERPGHRGPRARHARVPRRRASPTRAPSSPGADRHLVPRRGRADHGDHRQHRRRARRRSSTSCPGSSTPRAARCSSTASTCANSTRTCCGARSATCRRSRSCSPAPWRRTCASAAPTPPTASCGRRSRSPRRPTSCRRCPTGSTARSPRAARTCRAASDNGCRSPGRSWCDRRSTCSTTRSRRSTSAPTPGCGPRSTPHTTDAAC